MCVHVNSCRHGGSGRKWFEQQIHAYSMGRDAWEGLRFPRSLGSAFHNQAIHTPSKISDDRRFACQLIVCVCLYLFPLIIVCHCSCSLGSWQCLDSMTPVLGVIFGPQKCAQKGEHPHGCSVFWASFGGLNSTPETGTKTRIKHEAPTWPP